MCKREHYSQFLRICGIPHLVVAILLISTSAAAQNNGYSLRFYGNGVNDIDRVKILIDDPADNLPGPPADVGAEDFTIEFWMKGLASENTSSAINCNSYEWINGNIILDRDRFNQGRGFGISIAGGVVTFGINNEQQSASTICGGTNVLDNVWHHVAIQRRRSDGFIWVYVDGQLEASEDGPDGDISYPDDGVPGNFCNGPCTNSDPYLVIGAEKHDVGPGFPSFSGWVDELRISNSLRYSGPFTPPSAPFTPDANTMALYNMDEGAGNTINDISGAQGGPSNGIRNFGGSPAGPVWSGDTPFGMSPPPDPSLNIADITVPEGNSGTSAASFTVTLSASSTSAVNVDWATADGSATAGEDYSSGSGTLTIPAGNTTGTIAVQVTGDTSVEPDETFTVTLSNPVNATISDGDATATITNDDSPPPPPASGPVAAYGFSADSGTILSDVTGNGNDGTISGAVWTTGRFDNALQFDGTDDLVTIPDAASLDLSDSLTVMAWVNPAVTPTGWRIILMKEAVNSAAWFLAANSGQNRPAAGVNIGGEQIIQGDSQLTANTWVHLAGTYDGSTLRLYVDGAEVSSRTLSGSFLQTGEPLSIGGDGIWGDFFNGVIDEIRIYGRALSAAEIQNDMNTAVDDSPPPPPTPALSIADISIPEGNSGTSTASFTVTLSASSTSAVNVDWATSDGSATAGEDYSSGSGTLTIPAGNTTGTIEVQVTGDTSVEPDETFTVTLSNPVNATISDGDATATITNDDSPPPPTPALSIADISIPEGNSGTSTASFSVTLSTSSTSAVTVDWATSDGSGSAGEDYTSGSGTLTIPAGNTTGTIAVQVTGDTSVEPDETFTVTLSNPVNATISDGDATATITNDDSPPPPPASGPVAAYGFSAGSGTILSDVTGNGNDGTISGAVWTTGRFDNALQFDGTDDLVTIPDAASLDLSDSLTVMAWVNPAVTPTGWRIILMKEAVNSAAWFLAANSGQNRPAAGVNNGGEQIIQGDSQLTANTWVHLAGTYDGSTLRLYVDGAEVSNRALSGSFLQTGEPLRIGGDGIWGDFFNGVIDEIRIYGRALSAAEIQNDMNTAVDDSPPPPPTPALSIADISIPEGNSGTSTASFTVTLSASSTSAVNVDWATSDGSATAGEDYSSGSGTLTIPAGNTTGTIEVQVTGDTSIEPDETFTVTLSNPVNATISDGDATATITNDDSPPPPPASGPVAAYGFSAGSGTILSDVTGNGNDGTISGAVWTIGRFDSALQFDGTDDLVTIPDAASLDLSDSLTVMAWVNPAVTPTGWRIILMKEAVNSAAWFLAANSGQNRPAAGVNIGGEQITQGVTGLTANTWVHLAGTYDGTTLRLYVDGVEVSNRTLSGSFLQTGEPLSIGGDGIWGDFFNGVIDEIRIYGRALSAAEIQNDMNTAVTSSSPQLAKGIVRTVSSFAPAAFALGQNYPNPFNAGTTIRFALPAESHVQLEIVTTTGRLIRRLVDAPLTAGEHVVQWDGRDAFGRDVASGVYIYRLRNEEQVLNRQLVLTK